MSNNKETKSISEMSSSKKISFFSAMFIVIGGSIGAGIFFKSESVLKGSQGSLALAIFSWIIGSFAVIAMALALIEIASVKNDNLSLISWTKIFNGKVIYNATKNFMVYVYLPLTYFFMPLYVILSLQDGIGALINQDAFIFGTQADWVIWTIISLAMSAYFLIVPSLWSKVGNIQNQIVTYIKFIPLAFVAIIGFVLKGTVETSQISVGIAESAAQTIATGGKLGSVYGTGAGIGIFLSVSAIFFAYDGFYVAAGISSEMKEPKKTPLALFLGLAITTAIYLVIAISMSINGGDFFGMRDSMAALFSGGANANEAAKETGQLVARIIFGIMNIGIAIGVLGILNGFSMWAPRYVEDLIAQGELPYWEKYHKKLNPNFPVVGVIYSLIITVPIVILFTIIGALGYSLTNSAYEIYSNDTMKTMGKLYSFADLMANWTALFTFGFIGFAIYGALKNKKTNKIEIPQKVKFFKLWAVSAIILILLSLAVTMLVPIIDLILLGDFSETAYLAANTGKTASDAKEFFQTELISRIMLVIVLGIFIALCFAPSAIQDAINKKKYGSLAKFDEHRTKVLGIEV
ncbi:APC family permease [Mycoplasma sp. 1018B]|uniref:APC family permease n=1 Tax=Mycoplasma sp. 1018B TaxID=2967302 RepID=UPI00211C24B4|nr:APC family permease [Mycoplasma sp. 1018B]UUM19484.1 APC family permease [Mycoplasma sp. 1018B]